MADDTKKSWSDIPWFNVVAFAAAVGGLFSLLAPLTSSRPPEKGAGSLGSFGEQQVDARLWQDPFPLVQRRAAQIDYDHHGDPASMPSLTDMAAKLKTESENERGEKVLVVPITVLGGPYADQSEWRQRMRQAVAAGLSVSGFGPRDTEHIAFFRIRRPSNSDELQSPPGTSWASTEGVGESLIIPYEWFEPKLNDVREVRPINVRRVLLLWVREDALSDRPLRRLAWLIQGLRGNVDRSRLLVRCIAPNSSTGLEKMLKEARDGSDSLTRAELSDVQLITSSATAPHYQLMSVRSGEAELPSPEDVFEKKVGGLKFQRAIATDDQVLDALIQELRTRAIHVDEPSAPVAILSEWDYTYGRALALEFRRRVIEQAERWQETKTSLQDLRKLTSRQPANIFLYPYVRGLDGRLPNDAREEERAPSAKAGAKSSQEPIEGPSQADYLRRLAAMIKAEDNRLRSDGGEGLRAIGLLGSDVYDKLMILRALRPQFPGVVFFTNNLDARLLHPDEWQATRDLVVAAPWGLTLADRLQQGVPPFRSSYQTAAYVATLMVTGRYAELLECASVFPVGGRIPVFEIGRDGAVPLDRVESLGPLHPVRYGPWWWPLSTSATFLTAAGLLGFFFWFRRSAPDAAKPTTTEPLMPPVLAPVATPQWRRVALLATRLRFGGLHLNLAFFRRRKIVRWIAPAVEAPSPEEALRGAPPASSNDWLAQLAGIHPLCTVFVGAPLLCFLLWRLNEDVMSAPHEPFALFDGISAWPSLALCLLGGILCVHFLLRAWRAIRRNNREIKAEFGLDATEPPPVAISPDKVDPRKLWSDYLRANRPRNVIVRAGLLAIFYVLAIWLVFATSGLPALPVRGSLRECLPWFLFLPALLWVGLTFFSVDVSWQTMRFIRAFSRGESAWAPTILEGCKGHPLIGGPARADLLDMRLIESRTRAVENLIYYPVVILALFVVAHLHCFDNWEWSFAMCFLFSAQAFWVLLSATRLNVEARAARDKAIKRFHSRIARCIGAAEAQDRVRVLREMLADIEDMKQGAFAPLAQQPVVRAVLLSLGSGGIISLLQTYGSQL